MGAVDLAWIGLLLSMTGVGAVLAVLLKLLGTARGGLR